MIDLLRDALSILLLLTGGFFFVAGTAGLVRFPDLYSRLHALTKADNVGLGLTVAALLLQTDTALQGIKLVFIWLISLMASATIANLFANLGIREGREPWRRR